MDRLKLSALFIAAIVGTSVGAQAQQVPGGAAVDPGADSQHTLRSELSRSPATLRDTVTLRELAASASDESSLKIRRDIAEIEKPKHRLPSGGSTSQSEHVVLDASRAVPNSTVLSPFSGLSTVTSISGFVGLHEGDNVTANGYELEPPDQGLAVNNGVAAEIVNDVVRFFDAASGQPLSHPIATAKLFNVDPTVYNLSDPQVFFDPVSKRWFFTEVVYTTAVNAFAIAVSKTSDPLGGYYTYLIDAYSSQLTGCNFQDCFPDYPKGGFNADAFFITADLFSNVSGNFVEAAIYVFPKLKLESGKSFDYLRFDDPNDFVLQPSVPAPGEPFSTARNGSEFLMSAPTASFGIGPPRLSVLAVIDTQSIVSNPGAVKVLTTSVRSQNYGYGTVPSTEPDVVGPYCKSLGATSAPLLDGGYSTFQSTIQKAKGNLYGALAEGTVDGKGLARDIVDYFVVHPSFTSTGLSASIVNQGRLIPPNGYSISYPAFGLHKSGAGVMGFTITNKDASAPGGYPSAGLVLFDGTAPSGGIVVSGQGYAADDGFTGCSGPGPGIVGRWGDYGAAVVDAETGHVYTGSEMIPNSKLYKPGTYANWGTYITQIY